MQKFPVPDSGCVVPDYPVVEKLPCGLFIDCLSVDQEADLLKEIQYIIYAIIAICSAQKQRLSGF